jgi:hypothetical protein
MIKKRRILTVSNEFSHFITLLSIAAAFNDFLTWWTMIRISSLF